MKTFWSRARAGCLTLAVTTFVLSASHLRAAGLEVAGVFTDHMVLQREQPLPVWGWAAPGEKIDVAFDGQEKSAITDEHGRWRVKLSAASVGSPRTLTVCGNGETRTFSDVLVGEVWLASGQSNMAWFLSDSQDAAAAIASADLPDVRFFNLAADDNDIKAQGQPAERLPQRKGVPLPPVAWKPCTPDTARDHFSAVAFYFARELHAKLRVPIGIISTPVGGTAVEQWISRAAFEGDPDLRAVTQYFDRQVAHAQTPQGQSEIAQHSAEYEAEQAKLKTAGKPLKWPTHYQPNATRDAFSSLWFNTRINPLVPFALRGVIWYQGEGNTWRPGWVDFPDDYQDLFPLLIHDWRARWGQGDLPFLFVQLPNWADPLPAPNNGHSGWEAIREGQLRALQLPQTGMAVAIDVGDARAIHPLNKEPVGQRLALLARAQVHGEKIESSGPLFREMKIEENRVRLFFDHTGGRLTSGEEPLRRFAVAGADGKFVWAEAVIEGETVLVSSPQIPQPANVRYAWETNPEGCNLRNAAGLPASPFRTDTSPHIRAGSYRQKLSEPPTFLSKIPGS